MSTYSNRLQPAHRNQAITTCCSVFSPEIVIHDAYNISTDVQRITLNASCMAISGERTEQLNQVYYFSSTLQARFHN